jgi:hypothetical protein
VLHCSSDSLKRHANFKACLHSCHGVTCRVGWVQGAEACQAEVLPTRQPASQDGRPLVGLVVCRSLSHLRMHMGALPHHTPMRNTLVSGWVCHMGGGVHGTTCELVAGCTRHRLQYLLSAS